MRRAAPALPPLFLLLLLLPAASCTPARQETALEPAGQAASQTGERSAPLLLELALSSPEPEAPYELLMSVGRGVADEILSAADSTAFHMPGYLMLLLADTLVAAGRGEQALEALSRVPEQLPPPAERRREVLLCSASLLAGAPAAADSLLAAARGVGDDELLSLLLSVRGLHRMAAAQAGYRDDLVESFRLWPAAPVHAGAYEALRHELLADPGLAARVADPFYQGGLWNELLDMAVSADDPPPHLWYLAARTRDRLGFYRLAADMQGEYLERWPEGPDAPDAAINLGRSLGRAGMVDEGMAVLAEYALTWPDHHRTGNLPWYLGDLLAGARRWEESVPLFRELITEHPGNVTADDAHFYLCYALRACGRPGEAVAELQTFAASRPGSIYATSARYWLGRLLVETGEEESGEQVLRDLVRDRPTSLLSHFARDYLGMPPWTPSLTEQPLEEWMRANGIEPAEPPESALRGLFLLRVGLRSLAQGELLAAEEEVGGAERLAPFYLENDVWERRPYSGYRMWDAAGEDSPRPRELWMLRYQRAWPELVLPLSGDYGLDPLLAWSIVRNESMFQPDCYSSAGARGLIQMIPSTSEYLAADMGWEEYSPDRLYRPEVSLEYGIAYISGIYADMGGDPVRTAAAYNAGPHNAARWGSGDLSTEEMYTLISYNETKTYVRNVMNALLTYRALYPETGP